MASSLAVQTDAIFLSFSPSPPSSLCFSFAQFRPHSVVSSIDPITIASRFCNLPSRLQLSSALSLPATKIDLLVDSCIHGFTHIYSVSSTANDSSTCSCTLKRQDRCDLTRLSILLLFITIAKTAGLTLLIHSLILNTQSSPSTQQYQSLAHSTVPRLIYPPSLSTIACLFFIGLVPITLLHYLIPSLF